MENNKDLYSLRADMDNLKDIIKREKNNQNNLSIAEYADIFVRELAEGALNEKTIKGLLKDLVKEVVATERVI